MSGKQMEGSEEQKRKNARESRKKGSTPSAEGVTSGASKQRHHKGRDEDHREKVESIRRGKQDVIRENTPEPRPGYGRDEDEE